MCGLYKFVIVFALRLSFNRTVFAGGCVGQGFSECDVDVQLKLYLCLTKNHIVKRMGEWRYSSMWRRVVSYIQLPICFRRKSSATIV